MNTSYHVHKYTTLHEGHKKSLNNPIVREHLVADCGPFTRPAVGALRSRALLSYIFSVKY